MKVAVETRPEWKNVTRFTVEPDQKGYEVGVFSGPRPYLWIGPTGTDPGTVITINVTAVLTLLRKAGHLA